MAYFGTLTKLQFLLLSDPKPRLEYIYNNTFTILGWKISTIKYVNNDAILTLK